ALLVLSTATYAWFTFSPAATVEPMQGKISEGGIEILISNSPDGPFAESCDLILSSTADVLHPVSTADLKTFSIASRQSKEGIVTGFRNISEDVGKHIIKGTVYLTSIDSPCDVYFEMDYMDFGTDIQALASMRFGMIIDGNTYIFKLDEFGNTAAATKRATVEKENSVYNGSELIADPSVSIKSYSNSGTLENPVAGDAPLAHINADEVITVDYFLYLEGCDENCFNDVMNKDVALSFGFVGV
ncbi:MAG: hypothetical protein MJ150_03860, partial [Clostridia bacterium]|nr:hypothetical protein [Clostridia bacterium]